LSTRDRFFVDTADQPIGRSPCLVFGLSNDGVQSNAELHLAPLGMRERANGGDLFLDGIGRLAPGEVGIDMRGGDLVGGFGRSSEPQRRMRRLDGRIKQPPPFRLQKSSLEIDSPAVMGPAQMVTPDREEFIGDAIARIVIGEHSIAFEFRLIAARHDIDEQTPLREPIERGGHAGGQRGRAQPGAHGHEELQALRRGDQARRDDPRVFA
jgi:hypothetical protein